LELLGRIWSIYLRSYYENRTLATEWFLNSIIQGNWHRLQSWHEKEFGGKEEVMAKKYLKPDLETVCDDSCIVP
jgi:hypothetical protein